MEGWDVGEGIFAYIEGFCFLIWAGTLWLKKAHKLRSGWEDYEERIMKSAFAVFAISFLGSTLFVAPFLQFEHSEKYMRAATNEIARLKPASGEAPYATLAKELTDERKARIKAEDESEANRKHWIDLLTATNTSTAPSAYDSAIEILKRDRSTNREPDKSLQYERDLMALRVKQEMERRKAYLAPAYSIWRYAVSEFKTMLAEQSKKCGGQVELIILPSMDDLCHGIEAGKQIITGTNCNWKAYYSITETRFALSITGSKTKPARLQFDGIEPELHITDEPTITSERIPIADTTNRIIRVNYLLNLLFVSQKEEFQ